MEVVGDQGCAEENEGYVEERSREEEREEEGEDCGLCGTLACAAKYVGRFEDVPRPWPRYLVLVCLTSSFDRVYALAEVSGLWKGDRRCSISPELMLL